MSSPFFENPVHQNRVFCFLTVFENSGAFQV